MKRYLMRLMILLAALTIGISMMGFAFYTFAWWTYVGRAQDQIHALWQSAPTQYELTLTGEEPHIGGYPMRPRFDYAGKIMHPSGLTFDIPKLSYTGYPAPAQPLVLEAPQGLTVVAPMIGRTLAFEKIILQVTLPRSFPKGTDKQSIAAWEQRKTPMIIDNLDLTMNSQVHITGSGMLGLDENLQLAGFVNAHVVGMDAILDGVGGKDAAIKDAGIARQFLKMMSKTDAKTGETYFETTLQVQNGGFFFGPIRFATFPQFDWDTLPTVPHRLKPE